MAKYTPGFKKKVKDDYVKGKYATFTDLARAHKITNTKLISRWRKEDNWDDEFKVMEDARKAAELAIMEKEPSQNEGRELEEYRELSTVHNTLWKAMVAQIATRFKRRDDGTVPQLNESQLESLSRILLRAQEGQRKALGIDDPNVGDQTITINYPGLAAICQNPQPASPAEEIILDVAADPLESEEN